MNQEQSREGASEIQSSLAGLLSALQGAYPHPVGRDRLADALGVSRATLRQKIFRARSGLGPDALRMDGASVALTEAGSARLHGMTLPAAPTETTSKESPELARQFRRMIVSLAEVDRKDARALLVSQPWVVRSLPAAEIGQFFNLTRPKAQHEAFFGEWRNLETLLLTLHGAHRDMIVSRTLSTKRIAKRSGERSVYRRAHLMGSFILAGESSLPQANLLSKQELWDLPNYDKLLYFSRLYMENRGPEAVQATEWASQTIGDAPEAEQAHFWRNAATLSMFSCGRSFADHARRQARTFKSTAIDQDSQRCLLVSEAREAIHQKDPDAAVSKIQQYELVSNGMHWASTDRMEVLAKAALLRGDLPELRKHRNAFLAELRRLGHDQKVLCRETIRIFDAALG